MTKHQNIRIVKDETNPETPELLAASIVKISKGFEQLQKAGLNEKAIICLLKGMEGMNDVSVVAIRMVINNLPKLASYYIRKPAK